MTDDEPRLWPLVLAFIAALAVIWLAITHASGRQLAHSVPACPGTTVILGHSEADLFGGAAEAFARKYAALKKCGTKIAIDGPCVSACAIVTALPAAQVCITEHAVLGLHLASDARSNRLDPAWTAAAIRRIYPPALQAWIARHGGLDAEPKWVGYDDLLAIFPPCIGHNWHWNGPSDLATAQWYSAQHNKQGQWCCDQADGHAFYDDYTLDANGDVEFDSDGTHYHLPSYMVLDGPNPTGHAVWWFMESGPQRVSYCFAPGSAG